LTHHSIYTSEYVEMDKIWNMLQAWQHIQKDLSLH
jgi:hypothetical protein